MAPSSISVRQFCWLRAPASKQIPLKPGNVFFCCCLLLLLFCLLLFILNRWLSPHSESPLDLTRLRSNEDLHAKDILSTLSATFDGEITLALCNQTTTQHKSLVMCSSNRSRRGLELIFAAGTTGILSITNLRIRVPLALIRIRLVAVARTLRF